MKTDEDLKLLSNRKELSNILENAEGCIVYGAGLVGICLIQYLLKEKMAEKIICVGVKSKLGNPSDIMGVPVCELDELKIYKEKYIFLIALLEHNQKNVVHELKEFGCKNLFGIGNLLYAGIRENLNSFTPDILNEFRKGIANIYQRLEDIDNKFEKKFEKTRNELTYLIEEQNEISAINTKAFAEYQNCFRGQDIVIVATGPSLNSYAPIKDAIHVGVNKAYKNTTIPLDFLFVQDGRPEFLKEKFVDIEKVNCKIFMGRLLKRFHEFEYTEFPEQYRLGKNVSDYIISHNYPNERIYRDICHHPVSGGVTVTFSALQFALYTYPKRIYLVGCDSAGREHYDGSVDKVGSIGDVPLSTLRDAYQMMKTFAEMHYPDIEIISINPVGLKGIFNDMYMNENEAIQI